MTAKYYVVNAGGQATHIMKSNSPVTPSPPSPGGIPARAPWSGGNPDVTLCGLQATGYAGVSSPDEASCQQCRRHWHLAAAAETHALAPLRGLTREQSEVQLRRAPKARMLIPALVPGKAAKPGRCPRCGRRAAGVWNGRIWTDGAHLSVDGAGYCPGP
jgi:hypothetical protein